MPRRCEHGVWHEETYFEIIDGLNKEKPMPEARKGTDVDANYAYH